MPHTLKLLHCIIALSLAGCATQKQMQSQEILRPLLRQGNAAGALTALERDFGQENTLYKLEYGELSFMLGADKLNASDKSFLQVDQEINDWAVEARQKIAKTASNFGGFFLGEGLGGRYTLKDYEISFLSYRLAINHLMENRWDLAMVDARKMADREQVIANSKALVNKELRDESAAKSTKEPTIEEIRGYPVSILNNPQVLALKNSYQSAAAHYLAGFIYESQGETGLAAPGYRNAIELYPNAKLPRQGLAQLESNVNNAPQGMSDTLFIIESGFFPVIRSQSASFPIFLSTGVRLINLALPVIEEGTNLPPPPSLQIGGQTLLPEELTRVDVMSRRWLHDAMPGYVWRALSRALTSFALQEVAGNAVYKSNKNDSDERGQVLGSLASMLIGGMLSTVNVADVRHWSTLPSRIAIARAHLPLGKNSLLIANRPDLPSFSVDLKGRYSVVYVRYLGDKVFLQYNAAGSTESKR